MHQVYENVFKNTNAMNLKLIVGIRNRRDAKNELICKRPKPLFPGRKLRAGSGRKAQEIAGTWKQYFHRKFFGFFPMISDRFLLESTGN
jgi:hypothetical protein